MIVNKIKEMINDFLTLFTPVFRVLILMFVGGLFGLFVAIYVIQEVSPVELYLTIMGGIIIPLVYLAVAILVKEC